jgi:hypothetical protein
MTNIQQEVSRQMAVKAAIISTTNTPGWSFIKQLADNRVKKAVQEALDEDDRDKGESKRLKAKAMQVGFNDLWAYIDSIKTYNPQADTDESGLGGLEEAPFEDSAKI